MIDLWYIQSCAGVVKLADALDSKSCGLIIRVGSSPTAGTIFVVRKSYNRQKAQDIAYLVLFCYYILCFCRWTKSLNLTAAFRRFFQKTGLELTTYRFCSIGYYNFIIIFKREQVFRFSLFCCCLSVVSQR